ncbi:MAG: aldehyde ferredoxin oxidoreductase family protein [Nitrososphaeria archaeon]
MEKEWNGFVGRILRINLTDKKVTKRELDEKIAKSFLGGVGYSAKILWDELKPGIDPLCPENKFIISTGPLTGTLCPGSDSWIACFKSPLTNCWGEARSGGGLGPELKRAGYDFVILEGASKEPVYISICDEEVEIKPADHLWGKLIPETVKTLKRDHGLEAKVCCIGPAGENLVRFANVMTEGDRAAGRCGAGAVMGSKKVKAVVVRGHGGVTVADPETFISIIEEIEKEFFSPLVKWIVSSFSHGTMSFGPFYDEIGEVPTKYGISNYWGKWEEVYESLTKHIITFRACESCIMGCGLYSEVKHGKWLTPPCHGPEYETICSFGSMILNDDPEAIIHANYLCNIYGMDTISCGNVIAFIMECFERGWITKEDTDGIEMTWGNMDAVMTMIHKIALRDGFGRILGEGVRRTAEYIGKGAPEIALHIKGLEFPYHDPRNSRTGKSWLLQYGTANRGMCHIHPQEPSVLRGYYTKLGFKESDWPGIEEPYREDGKAKIVKWCQDYGTIAEVLGVCKFYQYIPPAITPQKYSAILSSVTGWKISVEDLFKIGERVFNLQRCFNIREGIRRKDDLVPKRLCEVPAFGPFSKIRETATTNYEAMLDEYYEVRGWNKDGIPSLQKLKELELEDVAKCIHDV